MLKQFLKLSASSQEFSGRFLNQIRMQRQRLEKLNKKSQAKQLERLKQNKNHRKLSKIGKKLSVLILVMMISSCSTLESVSEGDLGGPKQYWKPRPYKPLIEKPGVFINSRDELLYWVDLDLANFVLLEIDEINEGQKIINRCEKWP